MRKAPFTTFIQESQKEGLGCQSSRATMEQICIVKYRGNTSDDEMYDETGRNKDIGCARRNCATNELRPQI